MILLLYAILVPFMCCSQHRSSAYMPRSHAVVEFPVLCWCIGPYNEIPVAFWALTNMMPTPRSSFPENPDHNNICTAMRRTTYISW